MPYPADGLNGIGYRESGGGKNSSLTLWKQRFGVIHKPKLHGQRQGHTGIAASQTAKTCAGRMI